MAWVVFSTAPDMKTARGLARSLVERKAAACVTCLPGGLSVYRWKGKIVSAKESLLVAKTSRRKLKEAVRILQEFHPYDLPEVVALRVAAGSKKYIDWIKRSVK